MRTDAEFEVARDLSGKSVVLVEPSIQLYEMQASGLMEPRADWTRAARRDLPAAIHDILRARQAALKPEYRVPPELDTDAQIRQVLALNEAVINTIYTHSYLHVPLPTRGVARKKALSWTLGPGVAAIRDATGADYMLNVIVRDSYTSGGRAALMIAAAVLQLGILQGGQQYGIATLVDLHTGDVVWFNVMSDSLGDLRDPKGTRETADKLLKGMPL
ncbi:hypothetical protein C7S18_10675 [Ahniella affigens]|uniref:Uncharacterized protein n=2 Tax=Ahniella affigens TaxID=2021234 RepID=A0A2P1PS05_9GAMM|nr:hypothetical protein C7S18_10675 [Ahniella affigens]